MGDNLPVARRGWTYDAEPSRQPAGMWLVYPTSWEKWRANRRLDYLIARENRRDAAWRGEVQMLMLTTFRFLRLARKTPDA